MMTITQEQQTAIAAKLEGMILSTGLGDKHNACSIAAINLALSGQLTDEIPNCMSPVIGQWIMTVQDEMPAELRNSTRWKGLLPLAAGTGRDHESERFALIIDWMWVTVLPSQQTLADKHGFGAEWRRMTTERNNEAAMAANAAAMRVALPLMAEVTSAASVVTRALAAAWAASAATNSRWRSACKTAKEAEMRAIAASTAVALAAGALARREAEPWDQFDPCGLLQRLIG